MPDDIEVLCAYAGLDQREYKSFPRHTRVQQDEKEPVDQETGPQVLHAPNFGGTEPYTGSRVTQKPGGWRVLRSLFDERGKTAPIQEGPDSETRVLPAGSFTMIPAGGGVGVTTLLATLARIFSLRRRSVLLVDGANQSMLPFHFGGTVDFVGRCSFLTPRGTNEGVVSVLACGAEGSRPDAQQIWRDVRELSAGAGHVLMDLWNSADPPAREAIRAESTCVVVLTPDVQSVVKVRHLEKMLSATPQAPAPYYLLNRYDPSLSLHNELLRFFSGQLGERLLPLTIRRSDEVSYALAEGATVADYAPNSAIAGDFYRVADWLQARAPGLKASVAIA